MLRADRFVALRKKRGLYQKDMANELGLERTTYGKYEASGIQPPTDIVSRLASFFDVSADYLLGRSDDLRPAGKQRAIRVPILGNIPAGIPVEAVEDIEDYEELPLEMGKGGRVYFGLKIKGDSMSPDYPDGAVVIFLKADDCESGDDCAVIINGEDATFKKVVKQMDGVVLQPINATGYTPRFYSNADVENLPVRVLGIAVESRKKHGRFK